MCYNFLGDYMKFIDLNSMSDEERIPYIKEVFSGKYTEASKKHPDILSLIKLNNNSRPNPLNEIALEGVWGLNLILKYNKKLNYLVICPEYIKTAEAQSLVAEAFERDAKLYFVSKKTFDYLSEEKNPQGIITVFYMNEGGFNAIDPAKPLVVLDGLEIHGNIGTILRTLDALAIYDVVFINRKVRINHPKLVRSSLGSFLNMNIIDTNFDELYKYLMDNDYTIYLTDTDAKAIYMDTEYKDKACFVIGSEKYGISLPWYKKQYEMIKIPMNGDCDSLNVSIATSIILYDYMMRYKR